MKFILRLDTKQKLLLQLKISISETTEFISSCNFLFFYINFPCGNSHDHWYGVLLHFVILPIRPKGSDVHIMSVQIRSNLNTAALQDHFNGLDTNILTSHVLCYQQYCPAGSLQYSNAHSITSQIRSGVIGAHAITLQFPFRVSVVHKISIQVRSTGSVAQVFTLRDRCIVSDAPFHYPRGPPSGPDVYVTVPKSASGALVPIPLP